MMFILVVVCSIADICCTHTKKNYKDNDDLESPKTSSDDNSDNSHSDQHSETLTQSTSSIRSRLINICVIVMYLMWSWCSLTILQVIFDCTDKGDGIKRLAFDLEQICYTRQHRTFLYFAAIPGFIVYVVGAPCVCALILWRVRNHLGDPEVLARYGFLLAGYRKERFYWEMIIMLRRFCVVLAAVALDEMLLLQLAISSLICLMFLIAHVKYKPYATDEATLLSRLNAAMSQTLGDEDEYHHAAVATAHGQKERSDNILPLTDIELVSLSKKISKTEEKMKTSRSTLTERKRLPGRAEHRRVHRRDHSHGLLRQVGEELILQKNGKLSKDHNRRDSLASSASSLPSQHPTSASPTSQASPQHRSSVSMTSNASSLPHNLKRITSLPRITARTVAAYGEKVSFSRGTYS